MKRAILIMFVSACGGSVAPADGGACAEYDAATACPADLTDNCLPGSAIIGQCCYTGPDGQSIPVGICADAACHPKPDNDPVACAANTCTKVDDGCGGDLFCDTVCNTQHAPASCGLPDGSPGCDLCLEAPDDAAACTNILHPVPYHCLWQYPQPDICEPKSNDGTTYVACCKGPP